MKLMLSLTPTPSSKPTSHNTRQTLSTHRINDKTKLANFSTVTAGPNSEPGKLWDWSTNFYRQDTQNNGIEALNH